MIFADINEKCEKDLVRVRACARVPRGRHEECLGDTTCGPIRVADLGGRILKWAKTDEKL